MERGNIEGSLRAGHGTSAEIPFDFLRLPLDIAVRRYHVESGVWGYHLVKKLQQRILRLNIPRIDNASSFYTSVLVRHPEGGIGVSLGVDRGLVRVYSVSDRNFNTAASIVDNSGREDRNGKIRKGDILVGVNGLTFPEICPQKHHQLRKIVVFIRSCNSPVVLHLQRSPPDTTNQSQSTLDLAASPMKSTAKQTHMGAQRHPFETVIASRSFHKKSSVVVRQTSKAITQFTERARQWQISNSILVDVKTCRLQTTVGCQTSDTPLAILWSHRCLRDQRQPPRVSPHFYAHTGPLVSRSFDHVVSGTSYPLWEAECRRLPGRGQLIPLVGVRKALSPRILNSFRDGQFTVFTIWVHDVESGREWYAPLRYFRDFQDLREATSNIHPRVATIPFPSQAWTLFGSSDASDSDSERESKCTQLEHFLCSLCTMTYRDDLHPAVAEVAVHVQSFLGCDSALQGGDQWPCIQFTSTNNSSWDGVKHTQLQACTREVLKRSFQMYSYRVLLLDSVQKIVSDFVSAARDKSPRLMDIETMHCNTLKKYSTDALRSIKGAVDQLQDLILEGCMDDFRAIAKSGLYSCIHDFMFGGRGESYLDRLVREAVREQVEIAVYLPLRSTTSRLLVNAWRHEDAAVAFKLQELRARVQMAQGSLPTLDVVSELLKKVNSSALPCSKLRAMFDTAMEISRVYRPPQSHQSLSERGNLEHFSADDFLPAFQQALVTCHIQRPFALCALLRALCDPMYSIGEVGYYLASFEAAITHIRELDLSESDELLAALLSA